jgi:hypothetical protein
MSRGEEKQLPAVAGAHQPDRSAEVWKWLLAMEYKLSISSDFEIQHLKDGGFRISFNAHGMLIPWEMMLTTEVCQQLECMHSYHRQRFTLNLTDELLTVAISRLEDIKFMVVSPVANDLARLARNAELFNVEYCDFLIEYITPGNIQAPAIQEQLSLLEEYFNPQYLASFDALLLLNRFLQIHSTHPHLQLPRFMWPVAHLIFRCIQILDNQRGSKQLLVTLLEILERAIASFYTIYGSAEDDPETQCLVNKMMMEAFFTKAMYAENDVEETGDEGEVDRHLVAMASLSSVAVNLASQQFLKGGIPIVTVSAYIIEAEFGLHVGKVAKAFEALRDGITLYLEVQLDPRYAFFTRDINRLVHLLVQFSSYCESYRHLDQVQNVIMPKMGVLAMACMGVVGRFYEGNEQELAPAVRKLVPFLLGLSTDANCTPQQRERLVAFFGVLIENVERGIDFNARISLATNGVAFIQTSSVFYALMSSSSVNLIEEGLDVLCQPRLSRLFVASVKEQPEYIRGGSSKVVGLLGFLQKLQKRRCKDSFQTILVSLVEKLKSIHDLQDEYREIGLHFYAELLEWLVVNDNSGFAFTVIAKCDIPVLTLVNVIKKCLAESKDEFLAKLFIKLEKALRESPSGRIVMPEDLTQHLHRNFQQRWPYKSYIHPETCQVITVPQINQFAVMKSLKSFGFDVSIELKTGKVILDGKGLKLQRFNVPEAVRDQFVRFGIPQVFQVNWARLLSYLRDMFKSLSGDQQAAPLTLDLSEVVRFAGMEVCSEKQFWKSSQVYQNVEKLRALEVSKLQGRVAKRCAYNGFAYTGKLPGIAKQLRMLQATLNTGELKQCVKIDIAQATKLLEQFDGQYKEQKAAVELEAQEEARRQAKLKAEQDAKAAEKFKAAEEVKRQAELKRQEALRAKKAKAKEVAAQKRQEQKESQKAKDVKLVEGVRVAIEELGGLRRTLAGLQSAEAKKLLRVVRQQLSFAGKLLGEETLDSSLRSSGYRVLDILVRLKSQVQSLVAARAGQVARAIEVALDKTSLHNPIPTGSASPVLVKDTGSRVEGASAQLFVSQGGDVKAEGVEGQNSCAPAFTDEQILSLRAGIGGKRSRMLLWAGIDSITKSSDEESTGGYNMQPDGSV